MSTTTRPWRAMSELSMPGTGATNADWDNLRDDVHHAWAVQTSTHAVIAWLAAGLLASVIALVPGTTWLPLVGLFVGAWLQVGWWTQDRAERELRLDDVADVRRTRAELNHR